MPDLNPIHRQMIERFFALDHLPEHLQEVSQPFHDLAWDLAVRAAGASREHPYHPQIQAETTAALRKLLEAKDCAVRAAL